MNELGLFRAKKQAVAENFEIVNLTNRVIAKYNLQESQQPVGPIENRWPKDSFEYDYFEHLAECDYRETCDG